MTTNRTASPLLLSAALLGWTAHAASAAITPEPDRKIVVMSDATGNLVLQLNYAGR